MFVLCATAYAFFQVPYVAMPAEITDSYDERTRLMTWRVAILAFAIMLSGASAPAVRDALGGRAGYRVMGVLIAVLLVVGVVGAYVGTRSAPVGRVSPGSGSLREQLRIVAGARDFRLLLTTFVHPGAGDRGDARRGRLRLALGAGREGRGHASCSSASSGRRCCSPRSGRALGRRVGKKRGYLAASLVLALAALLLGWSRSAPTWWVFAATALVGVGYAGIQVFPLAMLPDAAAVDARRTGEQPGRGVHRRLDGGRDPRSRPRAGGLRAGAGARPLPLGRPRRRVRHRLAARLRDQRDRARLLADPVRAGAAQPGAAVALLADGRGRGRRRARRRSGTGRPHERRPGAAAREAARRRPGHRRPDAGLRLRLRARGGRPRRARGGGGVRRLERAGPDRLPQPAGDGERAGRHGRAACSTRRPAPSGRSPPAAPSRCCWPCRAPGTRGPTSSGRGWCCPTRRTRRSTRPRTTSACRPCGCRSARTSGRNRSRWRPRSTSGRCWWWPARRRTPTGWSTR